MMDTQIVERSSGVINPEIPLGHKYVISVEPKNEGIADGHLLRCWNCGTPIGEKIDHTFMVRSNKVEVGGIPLYSTVWRRCRWGKSNPACRAINSLPKVWLDQIELPNLKEIIQ